MAKKGWQFFLGEDVVAELDEYAKEWGMTRSAALTMIIKTVGINFFGPPLNTLFEESAEKTTDEII